MTKAELPQAENVHAFQIDTDGKYIFVVVFPDENALRTSQAALDDIREELQQWWQSTEPLFIISTSKDISVHLHKVSKGEG